MLTIKKNQLRAYKDGQAIPLPYFTNADSDDVAELKNTKLTNRNLLDNPWFTVNQREVTAYASEAYGVDRWKSYQVTNCTVGGSTISWDSGDLFQKLEASLNSELIGKTVTASILLADGTIYYGSGVLPASAGVTFVNNSIIQLSYSTSNHNFSIKAKAMISVKAVKLELGSVSTLANDTVPDYAMELLKCQRYFYRISTTETGQSPFANGIFNNSTNGRAYIKYPVAMRTRLVSVSPSNADVTLIGNSNITATSTNMVFNTGTTEGCILNFSVASTSAVAFYARLNSGHIDFSADL